MGSFKHPRVFDPLDLEIIDRLQVSSAREFLDLRAELAEDDRSQSRLREFGVAQAGESVAESDLFQTMP